MALYSYKASDPQGKIIKGSLEATNEKEVVACLQDMGLIPIRIGPAGKEKGGFAALNFSADALSIFYRITAKDVMQFTQDLSALLEAGLPVDLALSILVDVTEKEKFRQIIRDILKRVQSGSYLSDALAKYPKVFSRFYVNMLKAGETGGVLEAVLHRLGIFLENAQDLKDYIKSALVYPIFLVLVGGISIIILMTFVIPKFSIIFADLGQAIPLSTRMLLGLSEELRKFWWVILLVFGSMFFFFRRFASTGQGRLKLDKFKLRLPIAGELIVKIEVARFARTLGTLTQSGVPILQAISLVRDIIVNQVIAGSMGKVYEKVKEGDRLSKPLMETGIFPSLSIQMITVGEETGRLGEMLLKVAENYEKVVKNMVKRLTSFLEPAMILAMGLVVGFIVISMLMAIFSMNEMPF